MKIEKMERDMQTKEDLKTVALGTSKINYMDPRIMVAWCKRHEAPIEKVVNYIQNLNIDLPWNKESPLIKFFFCNGWFVNVDIQQVTSGEICVGNGRRTSLHILICIALQQLMRVSL